MDDLDKAIKATMGLGSGVQAHASTKVAMAAALRLRFKGPRIGRSRKARGSHGTFVG